MRRPGASCQDLHFAFTGFTDRKLLLNVSRNFMQFPHASSHSGPMSSGVAIVMNKHCFPLRRSWRHSNAAAQQLKHAAHDIQALGLIPKTY